MAKPQQFTVQQQAILDAEQCSVAVSAGAGCGKTFVLTQRFIGYLRKSINTPDPLGSIVAITFTDRAAREMRHRVRIACEKELKSCPSENEAHWLSILRALDGARISTIHAFCSNLLRRFAVEAGLDPTFQQLDVSFGDIPIRCAVRRAFCRLIEADDPDASQLVIRFGFERAESLLRELVNGIRIVDPNAFDKMSPAELVLIWRRCWQEESLPAVLKEFRSSDIVRRVVELLNEHEPSHPAMRVRRGLVLEGLTVDHGTLDVASLKRIRDAAQVQGGGGKSAWGDESIYEDVKEAFTALRKQIDDLMQRLSIADADGTNAATLALVAHRVAVAATDEYRRQKLAEGTLDFDDLLWMTRNLLRDDLSVRRRAVAGIKLLMVDEFQDTDPVQAELVRLLCGDQLLHGRLFLVGDAKQSIYRFRRADPRVFAALRNELPPAGRLPLTTNFRSQPAILRFVNYTFAPEIEDYEPLEPVDERQLSPEPSVEFLFSSAASKEESSQDRRRQDARWIAKRLKMLLEDYAPRIRDTASGNLRPVRLGDIAILFRTLSNVHLYEQALQDEGLDYYLAGGRAFFAQQEVHDVANLCRWLEDPADELSLAGALRSPLFGLNDDTLLLLKPDPRASFLDGLHRPPKLAETQAEQVTRAAQILDELRARKDFLSIADLLSLAIERTGYDAALLCEHLGERKLANLRKLVGLARSFDQAGSFTLSEFVFRLNQAVREQADEELAPTHPEVADVLRLMTIHQSKGLEFPLVVVADMDWRRQGGDSRASYDRDLGPIFSIPDDEEGKLPHLGRLIYQLEQSREEDAEQTRLFYVAATRAKDHLILSAGLEQDRRPRSHWLQLLARRFDLQTGLPNRDPYFGTADGAARTRDELPNVFVHHEEPNTSADQRRNRHRRIPLLQFRDSVSKAQASSLPRLMRRIEPHAFPRNEFSVTEVCEAFEKINATTSNRYSKTPPALRADTARRIGTLTHLILEQIDFASERENVPNLIAAAAERAALSLPGGADAKILNLAINKARQLLDSVLVEELAGAKQVHKELPFRMHWHLPVVGKSLTIVGTLDCLFEDVRGWHILDYKTAESDEAIDAQSLEQHRLQVATYGLALTKVLGRPPQSLRVVRLGPPFSVDSIEMNPETFEETVQRIDAALMSLRAL